MAELTAEQRTALRLSLEMERDELPNAASNWPPRVNGLQVLALLDMADIGERALTLLQEWVRGVEVTEWIARVDALVAEIDRQKE